MAKALLWTAGFVDWRFDALEARLAYQSPLTGAGGTISRPGSLWVASYVTRRVNRAEKEQWSAFLRSLNHPVEKFLAFDPGYKGASGTPGTPLINGASEIGTSIATDGWTPGYVVPAGLRFSVVAGGRSYMQENIDPVTATGGVAALNIRPGLPVSPADDAPLELARPVCEMVLINWTIQPDAPRAIFTVSIEGREQ